MLEIYIDADACSVKNEIYKVAARFDLQVYVVANQEISVPYDGKIHMEVVPDGPDVADDWIAENIQKGDIVITTDVPLADRCIKRGARVLGPKGNVMDESNIGDLLATRDLMAEIRQYGDIGGGPAPMTKRDKSAFLQKLDQLVRDLNR